MRWCSTRTAGARDLECDLIRLEGKVRRVGGVRDEAAAIARKNRKLTRLLADAMLDNAGLEDLLPRKW